jgi:N-acetylglucosaminyl-diphospho-decaprenol L-rhamnosyltransferase
MTDVAVGLVTVNYVSEAALEALIDSVPQASRRRAVQLAVADNSPDPSKQLAELVKNRGGSYVAMPSNRGYGHAINAAVQLLPAACEWILISNPDVILMPNSLDILVDRGKSDPRIAAVGPRVLNADGSTYPSARSIPSIGVGIGHALLAGVWPSNPWSRRYLASGGSTTGGTRPAGWLSGSCLLVRRSAFEMVGGFDEDYFMYFEDTDLGYRFNQAGFLSLYEPASHVMHEGAHSTRRESVAMIRAHHVSAKKFVRRRYPGPFFWPVRALLLAGLSARSLVQSHRASRML